MFVVHGSVLLLVVAHSFLFLLLLLLLLLLVLLLFIIITFYCCLLVTSVHILYFCYCDGSHMLVKRVNQTKLNHVQVSSL